MLKSHPVIDRTFTTLKSRTSNNAKCERALLDLTRHLEESPVEANIAKILNDRVRELFSLQETKHAGLQAVLALLPVDYMNQNTQFIIFSNHIRGCFPTESVELADFAADVWGKLVSSATPTLAADVVEAELKRALEWLCPDASAARKYAATLLLKQIASVSTYFPFSIAVAVEQLWNAIRDPQLYIREAAVSALSVLLKNIGRIEPGSSLTTTIIDKCHRMFLMKAKEAELHGAALVLCSLLTLLRPRNPPATLTGRLEYQITKESGDRLKEILGHIVGTNANKLVHTINTLRLTAFQLIPLLAEGAATSFVSLHLKETMALMFSTIRNPNGTMTDRSAAFVCIGGLAQALGHEHIGPYINEITNHVAAHLVAVKKPKKERCNEAVKCLAMVVSACPTDPSLQPFILNQLDAIFSVPVVAELTTQLQQITSIMPSLHVEIQERILRNVTHTLHGLSQDTTPDRTAFLQCFEVLCAIDFRGHSLTDICERYLEPLFVDPDVQIRRASLKTCIAILMSGCFGQNIECRVDPSGMILHTGHNHKASISRIVQRLIAVSVTDMDTTIRSMLLSAFTVRYDQHLSMGQCITQLFVAVEDESYANREAAMTIVGRLTQRNPACTLPYLRQALLHVTTELQFSLNTKKQVLASQMVAHIVVTAPVLVKPYVRALLSITIEKLRNPNTTTAVISSLLATLGKLAKDVESRDFGHLRELMPFVLDHVEDKSSAQKRQHALIAFGCIVHATGDVMQPYIWYPRLLPALTSLLYGTQKESYSIRREALCVLGIVGIIDPHDVKRFGLMGSGKASRALTPATTSQRGHAEELYPKIVIQSIMSVLKQPSLADQCYHFAVEALVKIFTTRTMRMSSAVQQLPVVIPAVVKMLESCPRMRDKIFKELYLLVNVMRQHVRVHAQLLLEAIKKHWKVEEPQILLQILGLVSEMRLALNEEFKPELHWVIPQLLHVVSQDNDRRELTLKVLSVLEVLGNLLDTHIHVVVPMLLECATSTDMPLDVRSRAIGTLTSLIRILPLPQFSSRIVHSLCALLSEDASSYDRSWSPATAPTSTYLEGWNDAVQSTLLKDTNHFTVFNAEALHALCTLVLNLGVQYQSFRHMALNVLNTRLHPNHPLMVFYNNLVKASATQMGTMADLANAPRPSAVTDNLPMATVRSSDQFSTLLRLLQSASRNSAEHWPFWLNQVSMELIRESPSPAFRACVALAQSHMPLAQELFNPAFMSCYQLQMDQNTRELVLGYLRDALQSRTIPVEVLQVLLNLSEYMSLYDIQMPASFNAKILSELSQSCQLYAKALRYTETMFSQIVAPFESAPTRSNGERKHMTPQEWQEFIECCEKMISLATKLGLSESAQGVLAYVQKHYAQLTGQIEWGGDYNVVDSEMCEKLQWWTEAWKAHEVRYRRRGDMKSAVGVLRAMEALGEWGGLLDFWKELAPKAPASTQVEMAQMASHAAWLLTRWDDMEAATKLMPEQGYSGTTALFYRAVFAVKDKDAAKAEALIEDCRRSLDGVLTALVGESYSRAHDKLVGLQQLVELEEIMTCVKRGNQPADRQVLADVWGRRLSRMQPEMETWQGTLTTHTLLLSPEDDVQSWLQFVRICQDSGKHKVARRALMRLLNRSTECETDTLDFLQNLTNNVHHDVVIAYLDHVWETRDKLLAVDLLDEYTAFIHDRGNDVPNEIRAHCALRIGTWNRDVGGDHKSAKEIFASLDAATKLNPNSYTAWHTFATYNMSLIKQSWGSNPPNANATPPDVFVHVVAAYNAYVQAICCSNSDRSLQDVLRLLSLWFAYSSHSQLHQHVRTSIDRIPLTTWLRVVPQIIARVHVGEADLHTTVRELLLRIAQVHPQAVLFPLQVFVNADMHPCKVITADTEVRVQVSAI
eukprot:PhM_4_TR13928/c0_g1_i1/m.100474/K07203/MTOR, FRAP, TOR; serine/threonine-protein kinase mTOR